MGKHRIEIRKAVPKRDHDRFYFLDGRGNLVSVKRANAGKKKSKRK